MILVVLLWNFGGCPRRDKTFVFWLLSLTRSSICSGNVLGPDSRLDCVFLLWLPIQPKHDMGMGEIKDHKSICALWYEWSMLPDKITHINSSALWACFSKCPRLCLLHNNLSLSKPACESSKLVFFLWTKCSFISSAQLLFVGIVFRSQKPYLICPPRPTAILIILQEEQTLLAGLKLYRQKAGEGLPVAEAAECHISQAAFVWPQRSLKHHRLSKQEPPSQPLDSRKPTDR